MSTKIRVTVRIHALVEAVVGEVGDFGSLGLWHPSVEGFLLEGEGVGAVRSYRLGAAKFRERLDEIADDGRGYRYSMLEGPFSFQKHGGYLWVGHHREGAAVEWSAKLDGASISDAALAAMMEGVFQIGLTMVKTKLESPS